MKPKSSSRTIRSHITGLPKHMEEIAVQRIRSGEASTLLGEIVAAHERDDLPIDVYLKERIAEARVDDLEDSLTGAVHFISSLSCVDGLVQMKPDLTVSGYGVEIRTTKEVDKVRMSLSPELSPSTSRLVDANHFGTRHRSMMRYCFSHPSTLGFIVSQDGDIRAVMRVRNEIVMWDNLKVHLLWNEDWNKGFVATGKKNQRTATNGRT